MKILFVTSAIAKELEAPLRLYLKGHSFQHAANAFQNAIIDGMSENGADFSVISFPGLPCFPHGFRSIYTPKSTFSDSNGTIVGLSVRYNTCIFLKDIMMARTVKREVKKWIIDNNLTKEDKFVLLNYQPSGPVNKVLAYYKRKYPKIVVATIIADYNTKEMQAQYAKENFGLLKRFQSYLEYEKIERLLPSIDKYILLTSCMMDYIPYSNSNNSLILEGLISEKCISPIINQAEGDRIKVIAYTGQLSSNSGIKHLVDAFMITNSKDYRLVITGSGTFAKYIVEKAHIDPRIVYKGVVSRLELLKIQQEATLLVNPRLPSAEMTKFSFPSKILEYMACGTPVLTYKLEGIPEEYFNYCFSLEDISQKALVDKLDEIMSLPYEMLYSLGQKAQTFIRNSKTSKKQTLRLINFIKQ